MKSYAATRCCHRPALRGLLRAAFALALLPAFLLGGCRSHGAASSDPGSSESAKGPAQIVVQNGRTIILLDAATEHRLGIQVVTLAPAAARPQTSFPAVVLSAEPLVKYRADYVAAQTQLDKAQIHAAVAKKEYERLQSLSTPEQNVSQKALQAAEATWQAREADVRSAQAQLDLKSVALRQEWGDVITRWSAEDSPQLARILDRSHSLVQLTIPTGSGLRAPGRISLELPDGRRVEATRVSAFPRVDPRVQGNSYLYLLSGRHELAPGLNLLARFPVGAARKGVLLPTSAVLWSQGASWVYRQIAPGRFTRVPAPADLPVAGGYLAPHGFAAGDKVVTVGAQDLLSEEILLHSGGGGDDD